MFSKLLIPKSVISNAQLSSNQIFAICTITNYDPNWVLFAPKRSRTRKLVIVASMNSKTSDRTKN